MRWNKKLPTKRTEQKNNDGKRFSQQKIKNRTECFDVHSPVPKMDILLLLH